MAGYTCVCACLYIYLQDNYCPWQYVLDAAPYLNIMKAATKVLQMLP